MLWLRGLMLCSATIEASIFVSQGVWLRTRKIRRRAKEAGVDWDELPEAQAWQEDGWRLPCSWKGFNGGTEKETTAGDVAGEGSVSTEESRGKPDQSADV